MHKHQRLAGADLIASVLFMTLGGWVLYSANNMKVFRTLIISPGLFPMLLGGIFIFCGLVLFIMAVKRGGFADLGRIFSSERAGQIFGSPNFKRGLIILLSIFVYIALFGNPELARLNFIITAGGRFLPVNVGFIGLTAAYLFFTFIYLKAMRPAYALTVALGAAIAVFFAFNQGFGIPIP